MTEFSALRASPSIPSEPVFVFGSNLAGRQGKGAALWARQNRGAIYGQGHGIQGNSYAIPTKDEHLCTLPLSAIEMHVVAFCIFAEAAKPRNFQLTPVGCGLAGYTRDQIEPLFALAPDNVLWPPEWGDRTTIDLDASSVGIAAGDEPNKPNNPGEA